MATKKAKANANATVANAPEVPRLKQHYTDEVGDNLQGKFNYKHVMQIFRYEKIVVNMGVGEAATDNKAIDGAMSEVRAITGQRPLL